MGRKATQASLSGVQLLGWISLITSAAWFLAPFLGIVPFGEAWPGVLVVLLAFPIALAVFHIHDLPEPDQKRWTGGLLRFGPFVAWLFLITKHKTGK